MTDHPEPGSVASEGKRDPAELRKLALLLSLGWLATNLGLAIGELPLKFLLKDRLGQDATAVAQFFALAQFTNYIKPAAGVLTDSFPLFGTRRRDYALWSLTATGLFWLLLAVVPRTYWWLFVTYTVLYVTVVFTSTTLGGYMVEVGNRFRAAGRLTAQRVAMFQVGKLFGGPIAGILAQHYPFVMAAVAAAVCHLGIVPLYFKELREPRNATPNREALQNAGEALRGLIRNRVLLAAAGMIFLIAASPGFETPILFYQTDVLHFRKDFVGLLLMVKSATGILAALVYHAACSRFSVKRLIIISVLVHAIGTVFFLAYRDPVSATWVTAIYGATSIFAMLPVYDLAARGTPRGSEALGYAVMMSVWNLTTNLISDVSGSWFFEHMSRSLVPLVWINVGTTLLALVALPYLPKVLLAGRDGAVAPVEMPAN